MGEGDMKACVIKLLTLQFIIAVTVRLQFILQLNALMFRLMTVMTVKSGVVLYTL